MYNLVFYESIVIDNLILAEERSPRFWVLAGNKEQSSTNWESAQVKKQLTLKDKGYNCI